MASDYPDHCDENQQDLDEDPLPFLVHQTLASVRSQIADDDSVLTSVQLEKTRKKSRERKIRQIADEMVVDDNVSIESSLHGRPTKEIVTKTKPKGSATSGSSSSSDNLDAARGVLAARSPKHPDFQEFQKFANDVLKEQMRTESRESKQSTLLAVQSLENFLPSSIARHFRQTETESEDEEDSDGDSSSSSTSDNSFLYRLGYFFTDDSASADGSTYDDSVFEESASGEQSSLRIPCDNSLISDSSYHPRLRGLEFKKTHKDETRGNTLSNPNNSATAPSILSPPSPNCKRDDNSVKTEDAWDNVEMTIQDVAPTLLGDEVDDSDDEERDPGLLYKNMYTDDESSTKCVRWQEQDNSSKISKNTSSTACGVPSHCTDRQKRDFKSNESELLDHKIEKQARSFDFVEAESQLSKFDACTAGQTAQHNEIAQSKSFLPVSKSDSSSQKLDPDTPTVETVYSLTDDEAEDDEVSKIEEMFPQLQHDKSDKNEEVSNTTSPSSQKTVKLEEKRHNADTLILDEGEQRSPYCEGKIDGERSSPNTQSFCDGNHSRAEHNVVIPPLDNAATSMSNTNESLRSAETSIELSAVESKDTETISGQEESSESKPSNHVLDEKFFDDLVESDEKSTEKKETEESLEEDTTIASTISHGDGTLNSSSVLTTAGEKISEDSVTGLGPSVSPMEDWSPEETDEDLAEENQSDGDGSDAETCNSEDTVKTGTTSMYSRMSVKSRSKTGTHDDFINAKNDDTDAKLTSTVESSVLGKHQKTRSQRRIELITKHLTQDLRSQGNSDKDPSEDTDSKFSVSVDDGSTLPIEFDDESELSSSFSQISVDSGHPQLLCTEEANVTEELKTETEFDAFLDSFLAVKNETVDDLRGAKLENQLDDFLESFFNIKPLPNAFVLQTQASTNSSKLQNLRNANVHETSLTTSQQEYVVETERNNGDSWKARVSIEAVDETKAKENTPLPVNTSSRVTSFTKKLPLTFSKKKEEIEGSHEEVAASYLASATKISFDSIPTDPTPLFDVYGPYKKNYSFLFSPKKDRTEHSNNSYQCMQQAQVASEPFSKTKKSLLSLEDQKSCSSERSSETNELQIDLLRASPSTGHKSKISQSAYSIALRERGKALMTRMKARREALKSHNDAMSQDKPDLTSKVDHEEELLQFLTRSNIALSRSAKTHRHGAVHSSKLKRGSILMNHFRERERSAKSIPINRDDEREYKSLLLSPQRRATADFASTSHLSLFLPTDEKITTPPREKTESNSKLSFERDQSESKIQMRRKQLSDNTSPLRVGLTSEFDNSRFRESFSSEWPVENPLSFLETSDPWSQDAAKGWFQDQTFQDDSTRTRFLEKLADISTASSDCFDVSRHNRTTSRSNRQTQESSPTSVASRLIETSSKPRYGANLYAKEKLDYSQSNTDRSLQNDEFSLSPSNSIVDSEPSAAENSLVEREHNVNGPVPTPVLIEPQQTTQDILQYSTNPFDDRCVDDEEPIASRRVGVFGF